MRALILFACVALAACVQNQSTSVSNPIARQISNEITVSSGFDATWERMVENLARSFFVINNIERASGIINVSFSSDNTGRYIDCGTGTVTIDNQSHSVDLSRDQVYPYAYQQGIYTFVGTTSRSVSLEGRVNIFVKEESDGTSLVAANARYIVGVNISRYTNANVLYHNESGSIDFNTNTSGSHGQVTCRGRGALEREILELAKQ